MLSERPVTHVRGPVIVYALPSGREGEKVKNEGGKKEKERNKRKKKGKRRMK